MNSGHSTPKQPLSDAETNFVEALSLFFEGYGLPRIGGRMIGLFLLSGSPLKAETIAETLQVSRSSVSSNLKMLLGAHLIERIRLSHDRSDYYQMPASPWQVLLERRLEGLEPMQHLAQAGLDLPVQDDLVRHRLEGFNTYVNIYSKLHQAALERWHELTTERRTE